MGFAEQLRAVRKERGLSQEDLAELLAVSRQAVSKWEQGIVYPEVEKILLLAQKLNVSLDYLLCGEREVSPPQPQAALPTGRIMIRTQDGKSIINCYKVVSSRMAAKKKDDEPQYALFGVDGSSFWGENNTLLGWYADEESVTRELDAILAALETGQASYELQFAAKVKTRFGSIKLDSQKL